MNVLEVIKSRRIIKKFKPEPIDDQLIVTWLQAASLAPNHRLTEPWEIIFIGPETRAKLNHKTNFGNAPVLMAVLSKHGASEAERGKCSRNCLLRSKLYACCMV